MPELTRRRVIGGIGTTALLGSIGAAALTGGASATAGESLEDPETAVSDDGKITYVAVQSTGRVEWDGFDEPAKYGRIKVYVTLKDTEGTVVWGDVEDNLIHDTGTFSLTSSWGAEGEEISIGGDHKDGQEGYIASDSDWGICQKDRDHYYDPSESDNISDDATGYALPADPAPVSDFNVDTDGDSKDTVVEMRSEYVLYDSNKTELTGRSAYPERPEATSEFTVTVENQATVSSFGGEDGDGDTDDNTSVGV